ncbi:hypothetical protein [Photobacterium minamisatsumaniensis]|uniref:hypothetical protein n=1 Tax=Photobacterium minamisatsumaniensis TaxID=2910233 RepID=UPI003D0E735B
MRLSRRGWNNVIIIGVVCFIAIIQLPELLKARISGSEPSVDTVYDANLTRLLPIDVEVVKLQLPTVTLERQLSGWVAEPAIGVDIPELVSHWRTLAGTPVTAEMMEQLAPQLILPLKIDVWLEQQSEPAQVTIYQLPKFWLLQNWQGEWLAVSVDKAYLFPVAE